MDLYIHYTELPQGKELADIVGELNEVLDEHGAVCGGTAGRIDLDLEDERIRTYNFPQGRVTDHRIGLTLYKIDSIMDGGLDEVIDALVTADQAERLKSEQTE